MPFGCKAPSSLPFSFLSLQLGFDLDREVYPLVVHAVVDEGDGTGASRLLGCTWARLRQAGWQQLRPQIHKAPPWASVSTSRHPPAPSFLRH